MSLVSRLPDSNKSQAPAHGGDGALSHPAPPHLIFDLHICECGCGIGPRRQRMARVRHTSCSSNLNLLELLSSATKLPPPAPPVPPAFRRAGCTFSGVLTPAPWCETPPQWFGLPGTGGLWNAREIAGTGAPLASAMRLYTPASRLYTPASSPASASSCALTSWGWPSPDRAPWGLWIEQAPSAPVPPCTPCTPG